MNRMYLCMESSYLDMDTRYLEKEMSLEMKPMYLLSMDAGGIWIQELAIWI